MGIMVYSLLRVLQDFISSAVVMLSKKRPDVPTRIPGRVRTLGRAAWVDFPRNVAGPECKI